MGLAAGRTNLCANDLTSSGNPTYDAAWETAQDPAVIAGGKWVRCQRPTCTLTASPTSIFPGQSATLTATCTPTAASYSWSANTGLGGVSVPSVTVFPAATTTYSVIGSNAFGSGSEATVTVTVTTSYAPVCTLTAAPGWISSGSFTTLRASCNPPATSYIWTGGFCAGTTGANCTVHPTMTTAYSVQGVNGEMLSAAATVTVRVVPTVPFPLSVSSSVGPSTTTVTASIAARSQDIGITTNIYVFAVAPPALVKAGMPGDDGFPPLGYAKRADGIKDASVACVLAQLNSSGELKQVTASSMQAYVTGVLTDQWRAVEVINGVATANIAGATFYVGYGTSASAMLNNGIHSSVVVIGAARTCQPQAPQTGWWWNPNEGGRGYSIESRGPNLVMTAYLYDITGRATWHWAGGPTMLDGSVFTGPLMSFGTGVTLTGAYQANTRLPDAGTITLTFDDATHGTLVWPGGTVAIQRYAFGATGVDSTPLANQPESGWWWGGAGDNGRGFFIEWQGARAFIAGYMYDSSGNAVWYVADSPVVNAQTFTGSWLQFAGGQTLTGTYHAPTLVNGNVAPVTIQFQGADTATLTLPSGTLPLTRFRF